MTHAPFLPRTCGHENEVAVRSPLAERTWAELEVRVRRIANGLHAFGAVEGERITVLAGNRIEYVEVILGALRGGTRVVPVNWHLTVPEVAYILADSGAKLLLCDSDNAAVGRAAAAEAGVAQVLQFGDPFEAWLAAQVDDAPDNEQAGAPMFYTSGTTGRPKGVVNRSRETTIDAVWEYWQRNARNWRFPGPGTHLLACPVYHAAPYACVIFAVAMGQDVVVMPHFDAEDFLRAVDAHRVTSTHIVPTQMARLLELPDAVKARYDTATLDTVIHGAAPCPQWVKGGLIDWLGPVMVEYYAFSEGAGSTFASSADWLARPGTVGLPPDGVEMLIVDDDGGEVPHGEVGTLYFRRPGVAPPEYHNAPEKTAASKLPGDWFTVGDVGWRDADGYLFLADRKIDMIISGGVNIYPAEVEACLSEHPDVADCAVFGVPDDEWGEAVKAAVTLSSAAPGVSRPDAEALIAWCRGRIATFKCPRSVDFHDALPRQASGKLLKRKLRDPYWAQQQRRI